MCKKLVFLVSLVLMLGLVGNASALEWLSEDIGNPSLAGSSSYDAGTDTWTVTGSGGDVWGGWDQFHYVYRPVVGDVVLEVNVKSSDCTNGWSKYGLMIRETTGGGSKHAMMAMTGGNGAQMAWRQSTGGGSGGSNTGNQVPPKKVRITRSGSTITGEFWKVDIPGIVEYWQVQDSQTVDMEDPVCMGMFVCSHDNGAVCNVEFEGLSITPAAGPVNEPWDLSPADDIKGVAAEGITLSWRAGDGAADVNGHEVYLGTDDLALPLVSTQTATTYDTGPLEYGTVYYWQIVEVNNPSWPGPVRTFKTTRAGVGEILGQIWWDIGGVTVADLTGNSRYPLSPDQEMMLSLLEAPTDIADNFGARMVGYLYPETGGDYTFWIASDDDSELWLSTSESLCDATMIANVAGWACSRCWDSMPSQMSTPQSLVGGQKYLIMALYKEGGGGDNCSVAWEGPDCPSRDVIAGAYLTAGYVDVWAMNPSPANGATVTKEEGAMLSWSAGAGATAHDVYHGTDSAALAYVDTKPAGDESITVYGIEDDKTYYWQVNEVIDANTVVEGCVWSYTTAEWVSMDIQTSGGSATKAGDCWTILADGGDIWDNADRFHFVYQTPTFTRDMGEITARVSSVLNVGNDWAKAGVMIRETATGPSKSTCTLTTPPDGTNLATFQWRDDTGGGCGSSYQGGVGGAPEWVKLVRNGNVFSGYHSEDGVNWLQLGGGHTVNMNSFVRVGLAVTSHIDGTLTTAEICDVSITTPDPHLAWNPDPADGATGVPYTKVLGWGAGDGIKSHEVYFGTDPDALALVAEPNLGDESYDPGEMDMSTTYYWQIVEVNNPTWAGPVWSFTTQTYRVIEDFESYDLIPVAPPPQEIIAGDYIAVYAEEPPAQVLVDPGYSVIAVAPDCNIVAHYEFEGNANDSVGTNHGTVYGDPVYVAGPISQAIACDATDDYNDYVIVQDDPALSFGNNSFSITCWIKSGWSGGDKEFIVKNGSAGSEFGGKPPTGPNSGKRYVVKFDGEFRFAIDDDSTKVVCKAATSKIATGDWVQVTAVRDKGAGQLKLYADGVPVGSQGDGAGDIDSPGEIMTIAAAQKENGTYANEIGHWFTGGLDDMRFYDCALSEGNARYLAGVGDLVVPPIYGTPLTHWAFEGDYTDSISGYDGVPVGDANIVNDAERGQVLSLGGDLDYVDCNNPPALNFSTGDWSICAWIKNTMTGTGDDNKGSIIANGGDGGGGHRYCLIQSEQQEAKVTLCTDDNSSKRQTRANDTMVNDGVWYHVAGVRDGDRIRIYLNGREQNSNSVPGGYDLSGTSQANVLIGAITKFGDGSIYKTYAGLIDDARIYGYALSEGNCRYLAEVGDLYIPPVYAPMVLRYEFEGNLDDSSGNNYHGTGHGAIGFELDPERGNVVSLPGGSNQYVSAPQVGISGNDATTIACWAKADHTSIPDWTLVFGFTGNADGGGDCGSHFNIGSIGGPGGIGAHAWCWEATILSDQEALDWHHYAMTYDGTNIKYYGDAVPVGEAVMDLSIRADRVHVGSRVTQDSSFPGKVDDARVYSIALDWPQIRYVSGLPTNDVAADKKTGWKPCKHTTATLEYEDPPHWGLYSLRMDYEEHGRVEHEWKDPRYNALEGNAKALSIWHLGNAENAALPLYVELESGNKNKQKVYHDDPDAALIGEWTEWNIALTDFQPVKKPVDLTDIKKVKIGLQGGSGLPEDGGTMIFDDIRLYPSRCVAELGGPAADFTGDCFVYYDDLAVMFNEWTLIDDEGDLWDGTWDNADVGDCDPNGTFSDNGDGTYTMTADGADVWGNADAFHYAYQQMSGDGQMIVRVTSLDWTDGWAKAGIMMRQDLDPNSAHAFMVATCGSGVSLQRRPSKGGGSEDSTHGGRVIPMCLKLVRVGDTFTGYFYEDGVWKTAGSRVIPMTDPIYVGMAATSHSYGNATTAEFDRACISSIVDLNEDGTTNFLDYAALMDQWLVEILWP